MNSGITYKVGDILLCRKTKIHKSKLVWKFGKKYKIKKIILLSYSKRISIETENDIESVYTNEITEYFVVGQKIRKLKLIRLKKMQN